MPGNSKERISLYISYYHEEDQCYYDEFVRAYADAYEITRDDPFERMEDGGNPEAIVNRIRGKYINKTSCTLVLCGRFTRWRRYVDYEIKATLESHRGLIGVNLPSNPPTPRGLVNLPERLNDNIHTGYALWVSWESAVSSPENLRRYIEKALTKPARLIRDKRPLRI
ncbi:MAG TPA: TIR domain-containing protein [Bacillota bacterium]|nr:TIR domain-containing protein [Bacillota bacterium]